MHARLGGLVLSKFGAGREPCHFVSHASRVMDLHHVRDPLFLLLYYYSTPYTPPAIVALNEGKSSMAGRELVGGLF